MGGEEEVRPTMSLSPQQQRRRALMLGVAAVVVLVAIAFVVASCAPQRGPEEPSRNTRSFEITVFDGRDIPCIVIESGVGVALSCDWSAQ